VLFILLTQYLYNCSAKNLEGEHKSEGKFDIQKTNSDPKADAKSTRAKDSASTKEISHRSDDDSEDEDEGDAMGDMPLNAIVAPIISRRRVSVSAESVDPVKLRNQRSLLVVVDKSPEVIERLLKVVGKSSLLRTLDEEQKDMIVSAFAGPILKDAGELIIKQGAIGDVFYLLESGSVNVFVEKRGEESKRVYSYGSGDAFGELALMYNAPRAATCIASEDCKLWSLDRNSFRVIVVAAAMQKREMYQGFLSKVPILQTLTEMEIMTLADSLIEERYENRDVICTQGDEGELFYIIKQGGAECYQSSTESTAGAGGEGGDKKVATLKAGDYFGEISLLTSKPRQATVRAVGKLNVLALDRYTFTRVLGSLDEIMKRNMAEYNRFNADNL
jgi:cAMP-dependent protein kinase regulator